MTQMKVRRVTDIDVPGLGAQIKRAREAFLRDSDMTLTQVCASIGMTTANWYRIEAEDAKSIPLDTLRKMEQVLGVDFGVVFD